MNNSVIRGTRDRYVLEAQAGQTMTVDLTSLENNAVFDIINRSTNSPLVQESTVWRGALPTSGNYEIVVGGTRGNATYTLTVGIE